MTATAIAFVCYHVLRIRRSHVTASIRRAGLDAKHAYCMYRELAQSLVELLAVALGFSAAASRVEIDEKTAEKLRGARASGNVVLLCAHTSNWELVAMHAASLFPLALIVKPLSSRWAARFITHARTRAGIRVIETTGALASARDAHSHGEIVATVIDQAPAHRAHGDLVSFLGALALVDRGPAVMAKRAHAAVFVIMAKRESGMVRVHIADEIARAEVAELSAAAIMRRATARLDEHVRRHPASWLWLHRRWKEVASSPRGAATFIGAEKAVIGAK